MTFPDEKLVELVKSATEAQDVYRSNMRTLNLAMKWVYGLLSVGFSLVVIGAPVMNYVLIILGMVIFLGITPVLIWDNRTRARRWKDYKDRKNRGGR